MGFLRRLWDLIRGNADAALSSIEDPEKILNVAIKDAAAEVETFRGQVARALVDQKRLEAELQTAANAAAEWTQRAESAVAAGDDALAREALGRRAEEEQHARVKYGALQAHSETVAQLKDALRAMTAKLEDAKRRRNLLVARSRNAEAQKKLADTFGAGGSKAMQRFDEMETKVQTLELEAAASAEMLSEFGNNDLEKRFKALPKHDPSIEAALGEIKARKALGAAKPTGLLGSGASDKVGSGAKGSEPSR